MKVRSLSAGAVMVFCFSLIACGSKVKGNTYEAGMITVAFQSGAKATFGITGDSVPCTYTESSDKITLLQWRHQSLTLDRDGNLDGPPGSFIPKLVNHKKSTAILTSSLPSFLAKSARRSHLDWLFALEGLMAKPVLL